ncbi:MAG: gliding motility-associated C-terminal domain-containing protein [Crocinitomicaceae bacterium]
MLVATTEFGCQDTVVKELVVLPDVLLYVLNTFTPDGDEFNQNWRVYTEGIDLYNFSLTVYNRWGETVWQSNDASIAWDGTYKGQVVQEGTYTWVIIAKDRINDNHYKWTGTVNVLK